MSDYSKWSVLPGSVVDLLLLAGMQVPITRPLPALAVTSGKSKNGKLSFEAGSDAASNDVWAMNLDGNNAENLTSTWAQWRRCTFGGGRPFLVP